MLLRTISHAQIDKSRWNQMVETADGNVFGMSWYLDAVAPNWNALLLGDYQAGMPLPVKPFPTRLIQPTFSRELAVYGNAAQSLFLQHLADTFRIALFGWPHPTPPSLWKTEPRVYQQLNMARPYDTIRAGYSENVRRQLKKAAHLTPCPVTPDEIIALFRTAKGAEVSLNGIDYTALKKLMTAAETNQHAWSIGMKSEHELVSAGFFIPFNNKLLYLKGAVSNAGKEMGAMHAIFDAAISAHGQQYAHLDFGGSNQPGLAVFNRKFGAEDVTYHMLAINKLPWPFRPLANKKWGV